MFDEIPGMANRGMVMVLFRLFLLHNFFPIFLMISSYHSILGSGLGSGPGKIGLNLGVTGMELKNLVSSHWLGSL